MKKAFAAWTWSLGVVTRSYRIVILLASLMALWVFAAYEWLGLAESSALLLILASIWAVVQILAAFVIVGGTAAGAAEVADNSDRGFPAHSLWTKGRKTIGATFVICLVSLALAGPCSAIFAWINEHSVEVASFLTFHSQRPVSHIPLEEIYTFVEGLLWVVLAGFLLSFFLTLVRGGWRFAGGSECRKAPRRMRLGGAVRDELTECGGVRGNCLPGCGVASHRSRRILGLHANDRADFYCCRPSFCRGIVLGARPGPSASTE